MVSLIFLALAATLWIALPRVPYARQQMNRVCNGDTACVRRRALFLQVSGGLCAMLFVVRVATLALHRP